jgi:glycosyltransferase involved in cell wall biosynthesis
MTAIERKIRKFLRKEMISLYAENLRSIILSKEFKIVHCHDVMATWAGVKARNQSNRDFRIVSTVHGPVSRHMVEEGLPVDSVDVKKVIECEKEAWDACDAIIAVDKNQAEMVRLNGAHPEKITVIPNAVDLGRIKKMAYALPFCNNTGRPWILVPRRLTPKNGVEFVIRAMSYLAPRPLLLLAGDGLEKRRLEELITELGLDHDVIFLGGLQHTILLPLMLASKIVVIPSIPIHGIEEATSIAAIEAMALGKVVIASEVGGLKELLVDRLNGILVPPGNARELAASITDVLRNNELSVTIRNNAMETAKEKFSADIWFQKHLQVYDKISKNC